MSIDKRPDRINNREEFGHWEADLIEGKNHSGIILTLTERISKILFMKYLPTGKNVLPDFVTTYRDPSYVASTASNAQVFQDEVWLQRRIELWGEGFSMVDIMRLEKNIVRFKAGVTSNFPDDFKFNIAGNDQYLLMRIPQKETNNNLGIPLSKNNNGGSAPQPGDGAGLTDGVTD